MTDIKPTFQCFDDALELINERVLEDPTTIDTLTLVHGLAVGTDGTPYAHAWVEERDLCWDAGLVDGERIYYAVARKEFYPTRQIIGFTRYTVTEACRQNFESGHYGPWLPQYRAFCGKGTRLMGAIPANATGATWTVKKNSS